MQIFKEESRGQADRLSTILHRIMRHLIDALKSSHCERNMQFVYKSTEARGHLDYYTRRIVELADGCSMEELVEKLYRDQLATGGWLVCLGLFEVQYKIEMSEMINQLIEEESLHCHYKQAPSVYNDIWLNTTEKVRMY